MENKILVRLKTDLSRYTAGLVPGVEGYTIGRYGMWSRSSDRFVGVSFPGIATLDVLWESLDIIDDEYLKKNDEHKSEVKEELRTAKDVVKVIGPRGGFRYLSYSYTDKNGIPCNVSIGFKSEADDIIELMEHYGILVSTRVVK